MELMHVAYGRPDADQRPPEEQPVADLLDIMAELSEVLTTENDMLRRGLPASLAEMTERKAALADDYSETAEELVSHHLDELLCHPELAAHLGRAGSQLQRLTTENLDRLETALTATRRRIDAVMDAVKSQQASEQAMTHHFVRHHTDYPV
jgi:ABC-type transporter Mla subunit MlaD